MKILYLFLALLLSQLSPALAVSLGVAPCATLTVPSNLRVGFTTPFTYNQSISQLVWNPGSGSKFIAFVRWVRPGAAPLLTPVDGQSYGATPGTADMSLASYIGAGTYAFLKGNVDQSGSGMLAYLRNLSIGHEYEVKIYEYDSVGTTAITYYPTSAQVIFTAGRFVPRLTGSLDPGNVPTLNWSMQAQYFTQGFQPEVSTDGVNFTKFGAPVQGTDSASTPVRTIQQLSAAIQVPTYYRIRVTYQNGPEYSNVILLTPPVPLPVELTRFAGEVLASGKARLYWNTASERNAAYFEVQRSADGRRFEALGRVTAAGSSPLPHAYQLVDPSRLTNAAYYRLCQVDVDGTEHFSSVITLKGTELAFGITLFPNPALLGQQQPALRCTGVAGEVLRVEVSDLLGRHVTALQVPVASAAFDVPLALPAAAATGVYLVHAATSTGQTWQGRLSLAR